MTKMDDFAKIIARLRGGDGCPWDRKQTHSSLKACCIEEAAEVICGINILEETGNPDNLKEELGDLLLQVVMQAQIAKEEGLFTLDDVINAVLDKMIRRHPHVFSGESAGNPEEALAKWNSMKAKEKSGKESERDYLPAAFDECAELIERARKRHQKAEISG